MPPVLADRELDVMNVLWDLSSGTVAEVREQLPDDLAYTTVLTILRTLEAKGHVLHEDEGKAHRYFPVLARQDVAGSALSRLLARVFQNSPERLLTQLVDDRRLGDAELRRLRRLLDQRLKGGRP